MMNLTKSALTYPLRWLTWKAGISRLRAQSQSGYRIIMLHGVGPYDLKAEVLEAQLKWLNSAFHIVPLDQLLTKLEQGAAPAHEVAITFDDGLACHADIAAPLLKRLHVPATFFVSPTLIDEQRWLWNVEARERLKPLPADRFVALAKSVNAPQAGIGAFVDWMKTLCLPERETVEIRIRAETPDFAPSAAQRARFDPLTWQQINQLDPTLFMIGSHTSTHPILTTLDESAIEYEVGESRRQLEHHLGRSVELFCYPNGAQDPRVRAIAARTYRAALCARQDMVRAGEDLYDIPRIPIADDVSTLAWRMHRPWS